MYYLVCSIPDHQKQIPGSFLQETFPYCTAAKNIKDWLVSQAHQNKDLHVQAGAMLCRPVKSNERERSAPRGSNQACLPSQAPASSSPIHGVMVRTALRHRQRRKLRQDSLGDHWIEAKKRCQPIPFWRNHLSRIAPSILAGLPRAFSGHSRNHSATPETSWPKAPLQGGTVAITFPASWEAGLKNPICPLDSTAAYSYTRIPLSNKEEWGTDVCSTVDGSQSMCWAKGARHRLEMCDSMYLTF